MYYTIVTFGSPTYGTTRSYYRSEENARRDAQTVGGGSCTTVRVLAYERRADAISADISDERGEVIATFGPAA